MKVVIVIWVKWCLGRALGQLFRWRKNQSSGAQLAWLESWASSRWVRRPIWWNQTLRSIAWCVPVFGPMQGNPDIVVCSSLINLIVEGFYLFVVWLSDVRVSGLCTHISRFSLHSWKSEKVTLNNRYHSANNQMTVSTIEFSPAENFEERYSIRLTCIAPRDIYYDVLPDFNPIVDKILKTSTLSPLLPLLTKPFSFWPISLRKLW
jgi:hypothetical protein